MLSETTEDYLKAIFELEEDGGDSLANLGEIARRVSVTQGTATTMLKRFEGEGLISYEARKGASLTIKGRENAQKLVMKHRLIECFLVHHLGMDWAIVHEEAERLEHAMSDILLEKLDAFLNYPSHDPHGHLIPRTGVVKLKLISLWKAEIHNTYKIESVDEDKDFLQYLNSIGLRIGLRIQLKEKNEIGQILKIIAQDFEIQLSSLAAEKIKVSM